MTSAEAKAYLTRARDAERDIVLLDDARGREILRRRYMERQTWEQIGEALCYDVRYCSRLHNMALASAAFT